MNKSIKQTMVMFFICSNNQLFAQQKLVNFVDPFIGTGAHGHTYPGATLPFGMVQLSPDNGTHGWDWSSGYHFSDSVITGFSHTHLSGTGIGDLCDISVMPTVGLQPDTGSVESSFDHAREKASPGFYSVHLNRYNIEASFTTTHHAGWHQYQFPAASDATIRFDLGFAINWDWATNCSFKKINDSLFTGYRFSSGWANDQRVYFAVKVSKPIQQLVIIADKKIKTSTEEVAKDIKAHLIFSTVQNEKIILKVGLSMAGEAGALAAVDEIKGWDFDQVKSKAALTWEKELQKVNIEANHDSIKKIFYTALYHSYLAPVMFSDPLGNFKSVNGTIEHATSPVYSTHSLWDTFRAANPLLTITQPQMIADVINSYLLFYKQHGLLPVWDLHFNETNTMTGYHAVPVMADAILKNIKGFDTNTAYDAMKASAMQNIRGTDDYRKYGYIPVNNHGESVTSTLEYAFDDWCIAQVALKLRKKSDYQYFLNRSNNFKNLFHEASGFFRAKDTAGNWVKNFNPYSSDFPGASPYTEGNAWQHNWFVPHAVNEHIAMMGGRLSYINKLDSLFSIESIKTENAPSDISGLLGQYAHGNEPSHHIAYLYTLAGSANKAADKLRRIMQTFYTTTPEGLSGNEDCGQMSAWYVFSALGFYPLNPASGEYIFGSPLIDKAVITLPGNQTFTILVNNNSADNKYIHSKKLNGKIYKKHSLFHSDILNGGVLEITMSAQYETP